MPPRFGYSKPRFRPWHTVALEAIKNGSTYREAAECAGVAESCLHWFLRRREHHGETPVRSVRTRSRKTPKWLSQVKRDLEEGRNIKTAAQRAGVAVHSAYYHLSRDKVR